MKYTIGELAKKAKLSADTIRFYEKKALIDPAQRADNNYRYYGENSLSQLIFIRHCRELGMSLKEIQALHEQLKHPTDDCAPVNELIANHLSHVNQTIDQLLRFKQQLEHLKQLCDHDETVQNCKIIQSLHAPDSSDDIIDLRLNIH